MNELPTVRGTTGTSESFPFRRYVYNGTEPFTPPAPRPEAPKCTTADCTSLLYARGLCSRHYRRYMAHGSTDAPDKRRKENRDGTADGA